MMQFKRGRPSKFWTEEREQKLFDMNARGATDGQIARALGVTRNTIIGKRGRMGLSSPNPRVILTPQERRERKNKRDRHRRKMFRVVKPKVVKAPQLIEPTPIGPLNDVAPPHTCRWVHGDPREPGWRMCGHPSAEQTYCDHHEARAFAPAKREAA